MAKDTPIDDAELILQQLRDGIINKDSFTQEHWKDIVLKTITDGKNYCLEQLLLFKVISPCSEVKFANDNLPTIFGQSCLNHVGKNVFKILHEAGINHISEREIKQLLTEALCCPICDHTVDPNIDATDKTNTGSEREGIGIIDNIMKDESQATGLTAVTLEDEANVEQANCSSSKSDPSKRPVMSGIGRIDADDKKSSCTKPCSDCQKRKQHGLERMHHILDVCPHSPLVRKLLNMIDCEPLASLTADGHASWLYKFLRYGEMGEQTKSVQALALMENEEWKAAMNVISSFDGDKELLNKHIYISFPPREAGSDWTLLSYAVHMHRADIVEDILDLGADPNPFCGRNIDGSLQYFTPFELSVERNNVELCALLISYGANLYLQSMGKTGNILKNAIINGNVEILKIILAYRRLPDIMIIHYIKKLPKLQPNEPIRHLFQQYLRLAEVTVPTEIFRALEEEDWVTAKKLIDDTHGSILDENVTVLWPPYEGRWSLIVFAAKKNNFEIIQLLMNKGISINTYCIGDRNLPGFSLTCPLIEAISSNNRELCAKLLQNGADTVFTRNMQLGARSDAWLAALHVKNMDICKLMLLYTEDPGIIFANFSRDIIHARSDLVSLQNVYHVFPLDVLKMIITFRPISQLAWFILIKECMRTEITPAEVKAKQMFLKMLLNFNAYVPTNFISALSHLQQQLSTQLQMPNVVLNRLEDLCRQRFTLQTMCRHAIRICCRSCDQATFEALGLPLVLEEYLQLPSDLVDPKFPQCFCQKDCYL